MSKIRIYELSKELDLDNRDILGICEDLGINVKSHSSTITDDDAERIRVRARNGGKGAASSGGNSASGNGSSSGGGAKPQLRSSGSKKVQPPVKKPRQQQILALRKGVRPAPPLPTNADGDAPQLVAPPRPPALNKPQPSSAVAPSETSAASPPQSKPQLIGPPGQNAPTVPVLKPLQPSPPPVSADAPSSLETPPTREPIRKPRLLGPPGKPVIPSKPRPERPPAPRKPGAGEPTPPPSRHGSSESESSVSVVQSPLRPRRALKPKPSRDEYAETKPQQAQATDDTDSSDDVDDSVEVLLEKPKRQTPKLKRPETRTSSPRRDWDEEEKEQAAAKSGTKAKRRPKPVDEDEDVELDGLDADKDVSVTNALSLERPPKPAALVRNKPAPKPQSKPKKPISRAARASSDQGGAGGGSASRRRDRREAPQRPELIVLTEGLTVRDLAEMLAVPETEIVKSLFFKGIAINVTQTLDLPTAQTIAEEMGVMVDVPEEQAEATKTTEMLDDTDLEHLTLRPPVVTIMGHVDHGKTSLLDSIRKTRVAQGEAGGITQHIGAYHVDVDRGGEQKQVVFLDTPGHEAFTSMRARGARVTDVAILVVAADDGVQPQTREAVSHARAAEVPLIVAINKIDKEGSEPDRVKQELAELGLLPEEWGGETVMVPVSALRGDGLDTLLEMILLVTEVEELSANPNRLARGTVIEANLDRARGPVATLLVQNGTLRVGDAFVAGPVFGKIRAMIDDRGDRVESAPPSFPVEVLGLTDVPAAGDEFEVFANEKEARALAERCLQEQRQTRLQRASRSRRVSLSGLSAQAQEGELKELNLIVKADVQGSVEAIEGSLEQLPQNEVQVRVLMAAPGEVTETDVDLAAASGAVILGFNTTLASGAKAAADREGVDVREYDVIYRLLDDVQGAMEGLLEPEEVEQPLGEAEVRAMFPVGRGTVAGCYVLSGKIVRNRFMRVRRGSEVVYQGNIDSLKRVKEDAREVNAGYECGINSTKFNDWKEGDIIEAYEMVMKRRTLTPAAATSSRR
ncbi:translation initiation factor IF-2 [Rubidibacter lacunae KORDI 51-2]|uniref:Translation initiation factor IF-2 n=1 Tax=Rubidibacter lacunae KORDI 51-2 TaxID=582515 RepID=U5D9X5_9CHRO|nr:translation initiation factor IF-2 [Rubidibacter lacunae]ERN41388.1 translation initiation factor IF-2 [Rubidibacter lacunae KORDI 51-2]